LKYIQVPFQLSADKIRHHKGRHELKPTIAILFGLFFLTLHSGFCQNGGFEAGFKIIKSYDSSRVYKTRSDTSDSLHFRPIEIDVWYPAELTSSDSAVSFAYFVSLLESRSNFYDDGRNYNGLSDELLHYVTAGLNCSDIQSVRSLKTKSYLNAEPVPQKFPLILYLSGFNGMGYENYLLFEALARKGFIVASVTSIGRYPGNMTMELEDLLEQVLDAEFVISHLTGSDYVTGEVGLIGYSWGGLASTIMAMRSPHRFKAVVSLDGSEQFIYGDDEEDKMLGRIRESDFFNPHKIESPFLYLDSDIAEDDHSPDSIYNLVDFVAGEKCYLKINQSNHDDFSCLSVFCDTTSKKMKFYLVQELAVNFLQDKLQNSNEFYSKIPTEEVSRKFSEPVISNTSANSRRALQGSVRDEKTNVPLQYVNIGILNGDQGTTTDTTGTFLLPLRDANNKDTLRISMVGYEPVELYLEEIIRSGRGHLNIQLREKTDELKEVVISEKKLTTKILGNRTDSKFFGGKFARGDLGSEIAIRIKTRKELPTYLEKFHFNISYNRGDTSVFRVNIYTVKNGLPGENIVTENILLKVNGEAGKMEANLSTYNIVVTDDIFIGLEWVEGKSNSGIVFSSGLGNRSTYYRKASQGKWRKYRMGVGFHITVKY
jgi:pimeloyl-ACP methyl ester carboxylesterase